MKKLSLIAAAIILASAGARAGTATDTVAVTVTFTGACAVKTAAAALSFTYTSFGAAQTASTSTVFKCSRGLTPTFSFDNTSATQTGASGVALAAAGLAAEGVIQGIRYTLAGTTSKSTTGTAAAAATFGATPTAGSDGSADEYTVAMTANIGAGQAGTGNGVAVAGTQTRTLTISY